MTVHQMRWFNDDTNETTEAIRNQCKLEWHIYSCYEYWITLNAENFKHVRNTFGDSLSTNVLPTPFPFMFQYPLVLNAFRFVWKQFVIGLYHAPSFIHSKWKPGSGRIGNNEWVYRQSTPTSINTLKRAEKTL